ncbi:hypothetical protein [Metabacillus litoralis]|jgi:hypothetical protein|uniref:hypothetical protein n=1 Tax=Metabacillus litoralis TaxID=152268 RepID=UPI0020422B79|nr:hypothetical protein [Metabacillus litoralis]MCM3654507.1 hypothetical protein [Metabacillus litoralis]
MGTKDNKEQELLLKQLSSNFIKEQIEQIKNNKKDNNSFIYLENNTLNMLIVYLLMDFEARNRDNSTSISNEIEFSTNELNEELDSVINNNKKRFEEILNLLKQET